MRVFGARFSDILLALIFMSFPFLQVFKDESKIFMDGEISCRDGIRTKNDYDTKFVCKKLKRKILQICYSARFGQVLAQYGVTGGFRNAGICWLASVKLGAPLPNHRTMVTSVKLGSLPSCTQLHYGDSVSQCKARSFPSAPLPFNPMH